MEITSFSFFIMTALSLLLYWSLPKRFQWYILLLDSVIFYLANVPAYTLIYVAASMVSVYLATRYFADHPETDENRKNRKRIAAFAVILNIGILAVLKYTNLAIHTFNIIGGGVSGCCILQASATLPG